MIPRRMRILLAALNPRQSLIAKIFVTFSVGTLVLMTVLRLSLRAAFDHSFTRGWILAHVQDYLSLLEDRFVLAPQPQAALKQWAEKFDLQVYWVSHDRQTELGDSTLVNVINSWSGHKWGPGLNPKTWHTAEPQDPNSAPPDLQSSQPLPLPDGTDSAQNSTVYWEAARAYDHMWVRMRSVRGDWLIVAPHALEFSPLAAALMLTLSGGIIAGLFLLVRRFLAPLRRLNDSMTRFSDGHYGERAPVSGSNELSTLAHSFNRLADRVSEELDARERLLADVSHELRSPLTRMRLAAEMLEPSAEKNALIQECHLLARLTEQILSSYRYAAGSPPVCQSGTGLELKEMLEDTARRCQLPLTWVAPFKPVRFVWNPELALIAVQNIMENIKRHAHHTTCAQVRAEVFRTPDASGGRLVITLADQGPAPNADEIQRMNTPFYRPDPSRSRETGGFGLGLHLARRMQHAQGGSLVVFANERGGLDTRLGFVLNDEEG